ncbi:carotenoid oxygenase family protein [Actinosynnema sp. NPDC047251]|uniref:Dioxygenase n=1 Tax=Saccharothrix espanaensis (strain ATCC 51144 / DSM 44229 / JCM 9112 / NBRC 15066 / NRRL 15764) TaxID=1179773 RepID=K0K8T8_SACES|nr:carotenoid oxygenase family protein [Saccharothrix espanaensis]CCH33254.1 Lignostilbene-alpha/beta-dioxygenase [Saccharothrix espanaensis DSM 44229]
MRAGFTSLDREVVAELAVRGELPPWLSGTLVRNGPAKFESGDRSLRHWFDGQAMLHRFAFGGGRVSYRNRFLQTPSLKSLRDNGKIAFAEFATDPCRSIFARLFARSEVNVNANVNVVLGDDRDWALTETPIAVRFDPETLATVGLTDPDDTIAGQVTTAHPHVAPLTGDLVNYVLKFGRRSLYQLYRQRGATREPLATLATDRPGYLHSFAITERHVVLAIFPLVVNPLSFLLRGRPFIENYRWRPELGTRFVVFSQQDGSVVADGRTDAFFAFHHINAYDEDGRVVVDLCAYPDSSVVDALYLDRVRGNADLPLAHPTRYTVDLADGAVRSRRLADEALELPRISYRPHNGRDYRYAYGVGAHGGGRDDFLNQLVKVDVRSGRTWTWHEPGRYPGEPVFVAVPDARDEDGGVLLSVVLDSAAGRSCLLVLDAATFTELARAEVPHAIPFGFHGQFAAR